MDHGSGSTLGLDFSKGLAFADEIYRSCGATVHPSDGMDPFVMVVSFSRHVFRLSDNSVAAALEATIGGSTIELMVSSIRDKVFSFHVSCKKVRLYVLALRSLCL